MTTRTATGSSSRARCSRTAFVCNGSNNGPTGGIFAGAQTRTSCECYSGSVAASILESLPGGLYTVTLTPTNAPTDATHLQLQAWSNNVQVGHAELAASASSTTMTFRATDGQVVEFRIVVDGPFSTYACTSLGSLQITAN